MKSKILPSFIIVIVLSLGIASVSSAYVSYELLSIPTQKQSKTNWCWAANSVMIIDYFGSAPTQAKFVKYVKGDTDNETGSLTEMVEGLEYWDVHATATLNVLSFSKIISEIEDGQPVVAGTYWYNGTGGHVYTIRGYYMDTSDDDEDVYYIDSRVGYDTYNIMNYDEFTDNDEFYWDCSIKNIYEL